MALPERVRVRLSSEAAGAISITPVVVQEMPIRELVAHMLAVAGKEHVRVQDALRRGSLVSGSSRFRWEGFDPEPAELAALLATFPDPDPSRPFAPERCVHVVLQTTRRPMEITRTTAAQRRLFTRASFWDRLLQLAASGPRYVEYSYRAGADVYRLELTRQAAASLHDAAALLRHHVLRDQIRQATVTALELYVER